MTPLLLLLMLAHDARPALEGMIASGDEYRIERRDCAEGDAAGLRGATVEVLSSAGEVIARTRSRKQGLFAVRFEPGTPSPAALRVTARRHCGLEWPIEETPSTGRCLRVVIVRQQR